MRRGHSGPVPVKYDVVGGGTSWPESRGSRGEIAGTPSGGPGSRRIHQVDDGVSVRVGDLVEQGRSAILQGPQGRRDVGVGRCGGRAVRQLPAGLVADVAPDTDVFGALDPKAVE
jgi:hypothetical protein